MHPFWIQSSVSLLVALIALGGVIWSNWRADKRRIADQAAEDARRKADDDRRERERRDQLQREDRERQRRAVADCIRNITKAAGLVDERSTAEYLQGGGDVERAIKIRGVELNRFIVEATSQLTLLDIEVTQPQVRAKIKALWKQILSDYKPLQEARNRDVDAWMYLALAMPPLSDSALKGMRELTIVARLTLLALPERMAARSVDPIDLEDLIKEDLLEFT